MSLSLHSNYLTGTATAADIVQFATVMTIAKIARSVTVRIDNSFAGGGSGAIVNRQGNTYTVLTASHVVDSIGDEYTIHIDKKDYPVTAIQRLQQPECEPKLAFVQFSSPHRYPVATLGDSDAAVIDTAIYVSGYPHPHTQGREFEFTTGIVTGCPNRNFLHYDAANWSGMSGAPIFNANGQIVGIHTAREFDRENGTDFKVAVRINTCIILLKI